MDIVNLKDNLNKELDKILADVQAETSKQQIFLDTYGPQKWNAAHTANYGRLFNSLIDTQDDKSYQSVYALIQLANAGVIELIKPMLSDELKFEYAKVN